MTTLKLRIYFDEAMLGPGKAELLQGIRDTGSIAAAGRGMGMSYKRAWMLVEEMNSGWQMPLVESARGGPGGGGAHLTDAGAEVLQLYREVIDRAMAATAEPIARLEQMLKVPAKPVDMAAGK